MFGAIESHFYRFGCTNLTVTPGNESTIGVRKTFALKSKER